jgi:hypothetical protein
MPRKVLLVLVPLSLYVLGALFVAARYAGWENEKRDRWTLIRKLGLEQKDALVAAQDLPPLGEACRGKLDPGGPLSLLAYVIPISPEDEDVGDHVVGLYEDGDSDATSAYRYQAWGTWLKHIPPGTSALGELLGALDPGTWSYKTKRWGAGGQPEVREAKYLAVTEVADLVWPAEEGDEYRPGAAVLKTRVISLPAGNTICEGASFATRRGVISGSGRGQDQADAQVAASKSASFHVRAYFINAIQYGPLVHLCEAGGKLFCEKVGQEAPYVR